MAEVDYNKIQALLDSVNQPIEINPDDIHVDENDPEFLELMNEDMNFLNLDNNDSKNDNNLESLFNNEIFKLNKLTEDLKLECIKLNRNNQKSDAIATLKLQKIGIALLSKYEMFNPNLSSSLTNKAIEELKVYINSCSTKKINSLSPKKSSDFVKSPAINNNHELELYKNDLEKTLTNSGNKSSVSIKSEETQVIKSQFQKELELQKLIERFKSQIDTLERY